MAGKQESPEDFSDLTSFKLDAEIGRILPEAICREHQIVLLGRKTAKQRGPVLPGMLDTDNEAGLEAAHSETGWKLEPVQLNAYEIDKALNFGFGMPQDENITSVTVRPDREQTMLAPACWAF